MTPTSPCSRKTLTTTFLKAASQYWLRVFPAVCRECDHWHRRAHQIPDPVLRRLALEAQRSKRSNVEGAAAFAAFTAPTFRPAVVRAQVAFQSVYDYVDTLAEQQHDDPIANSRHLHQALGDAITLKGLRPNYYALQHHQQDGGYLAEIVDSCRTALAMLPAYSSIKQPAQRCAARIITYQSLNLNEQNGGQRRLRQWAQRVAPEAPDLRWWETAAAAGSSLGLFALIAAASEPTLRVKHAVAIEHAYWPWVGALHSLLDSLIDQVEDASSNQQSLLDYYLTGYETARRLQLLTEQSRRAVSLLPHAHEHLLILAGMASSYLATPSGCSPETKLASERILESLGPVAKPTMMLFGIRNAVQQRHHIKRTLDRVGTP